MKKSGFKKPKYYQMKRSPLVAKKGFKTTRSTLKAVSKDDVAQCKVRIQKLLHDIVVLRDGGCVLAGIEEAGICGGYNSYGDLIYQAEHLNSRANNVSFAELDNLVCLCRNHHIFFKPQNSQLYWELIERVIGPERWAKYLRWRDDKTSYRMSLWDWQKVELVLTQELKKYGG